VDVILATAARLPELDIDDAPLPVALRDRGVDVRVAAWDAADVDWSEARAVVIRSTWDYWDRRPEFVAWAERVESVTPLYNPAEVIRWNTHKGYLIELEERGAPVVPTAWLGQGDRVELGELLAGRAWDRAIVKPTVDAGSRGVFRVEPTTVELAQHHLDALLARGDAMVQPFLEAIETEGELSVVFLDGAFSHAVRKRPSPGEFRIQLQYGGHYEPERPSGEIVDLAAWILEASGHDYLYARVDLVSDENGIPQLAELEASEPSLYLSRVPEAAGRLADAIVARL
jgi:glutathione synthase/RimK-type ligase-like ATP-grasp enzyme